MVLRDLNGRYMTAKQFAAELQLAMIIDEVIENPPHPESSVEHLLRLYSRWNTIYELQQALIAAGAGEYLEH